MLIHCIPILSVYGITPLLNKHILEHISVEGHIFFSTIVYFFTAILLYLLFFQDTVHRDISVLSKKPYLCILVFLYAFSILFVAEYLYFKVLRNHKAYIITALLAAYPLVTLAISFWLFEEKIELTHIVGALFIISGIIMVSL